MGRMVRNCEADLLEIERAFALWLRTADALMEVTVETQGMLLYAYSHGRNGSNLTHER